MNENQEVLEDQPKPSSNEGPKETAEFHESYAFAEKLIQKIGLRLHYKEKTVGLTWMIRHIFFLFCFLELAANACGEAVYFINAAPSNIIVATNIAACLGYCVMGISKMCSIVNHRYLILDLVNELQALWPTGKVSEEDRLIMTKSLRTVYLSTRLETVIYFVLIFLFNYQPFIPMTIEYVKTGTVKRVLPYYISYPFDIQPIGIYIIVFIWQNWSGVTALFAMTGIDTLFQGTCSHICMLLQLLHRELRDIIPEPEAGTEIEELEDVVCLEKLMNIIERHQKLLSLCEDLETTYSFDILVNVLSASLIICTVGFQSILGLSVDLIKFLVYMVGTIFQTLILSYYGNLLIEKLLVLPLFLVQSIPLCQQKVNPAISWQILGRSWSYFTLIRTMYDPNDLIGDTNAEKIPDEI